jgi:hypothetical protein
VVLFRHKIEKYRIDIVIVGCKRDNKMRQTKGPQFTRFFKPVIEVLRNSGGSGTVAEVIYRVIEKMGTNSLRDLYTRWSACTSFFIWQ